jgi:hypothetical protein
MFLSLTANIAQRAIEKAPSALLREGPLGFESRKNGRRAVDAAAQYVKSFDAAGLLAQGKSKKSRTGGHVSRQVATVGACRPVPWLLALHGTDHSKKGEKGNSGIFPARSRTIRSVPFRQWRDWFASLRGNSDLEGAQRLQGFRLGVGLLIRRSGASACSDHRWCTPSATPHHGPCRPDGWRCPALMGTSP